MMSINTHLGCYSLRHATSLAVGIQRLMLTQHRLDKVLCDCGKRWAAACHESDHAPEIRDLQLDSIEKGSFMAA